MTPKPFGEMSDLALLQLCIWREGRGEHNEGMRGIAHVVRNRSLVAKWWNGHIAGSLSRVILQPYQFSSFNVTDPNVSKWPAADDPSFAECCSVAYTVMIGADADNTDSATYYYDSSIDFPKSWGPKENYIHCIDIGRLLFWKEVGA